MARDLTLPPFDDLPVPDDATAFGKGMAVVARVTGEAGPGAGDVHAAPTRAFTALTRAVAAVDVQPSKVPAMPGDTPVPGLAPSVAGPVLTPVPARSKTPPPPPPSARTPVKAPTEAAPEAVASKAPKALAGAQGAARDGLPPLPFPVQTTLPEQPKRALPKKWRIAMVAGGGLLVLMVIGNLRGKSSAPPQLRLESSVAVHEEDLRKRREVSSSDFTQRGRPPRGQAPVPSAGIGTGLGSQGSGGPATVSAEELEARRARRGDDPADLRGIKSTAPAASGTALASEVERGRPCGRKPRQLYLNLDDSEPATPAGAKPSGESVLVPAGSSLAVELETPIQLTGSSSTSVVAIVVAGPHRGARLLGTASYASGRVTVRFRSFITAAGAELDVRAEARGEDGGFGVPVSGAPDDGSDGPSAEEEVAGEAGTDLVAGALGGIGGQVVRNYSRKKQYAPRDRRQHVVTVGKGEAFSVFVQSAITQWYAK